MITLAKFEKYAKHPHHFRNDLYVDVDGHVRPFGVVMDDWQLEDFVALDPALMRCNGRSNRPAKSRAYFERARGHSKTTDLAITCCWALAFATRPIRGYAFAVDKDQAGLLKDAMHTICRLNPWLSDILDVQKNVVLNVAGGHPGAGSRLDINTSDVSSSFGILPDLLIADELTHWQGDGSLWHSLISSAAKRSNCLLATISNAGFCDSWQWAVREAARTDEGWIFRRLDGPKASWMTPARLAEQRKMLPAIAYARLWLNEWSSGGGDALLPADIDAAFVDGLQPHPAKQAGWVYVAGLDLGLSRDGSAVVVLAAPENQWGKIRLAHARLWRPTENGKVNLEEVKQHILRLDELFQLEFVGFDPWNAELMASQIEADSGRRRRNEDRMFKLQPFMRELQPTAATLRSQAALVIEHFRDHRLEFYDYQPLRRDLLKLRVEEKSYGFRLVSPRDEFGHGDTASAFANALTLAHEVSNNRPVYIGTGFGDSNLTKYHTSPVSMALQAMEEHQRHDEAVWKMHLAEGNKGDFFHNLMASFGRL